MEYKCPYAVRDKRFNFLMCKRLMQEGKTYNVPQEAAKSVCGFTYFCHLTQRWENTQGARDCQIKNKVEKN